MKVARTFRPLRTAKEKFIAAARSTELHVSIMFCDVVQLRTALVVTPNRGMAGITCCYMPAATPAPVPTWSATPWRLTSCARASKPPTAASCQRLNTDGMKERCKPGGATGRNEAGGGARHDPGGEGAGGLTNYLNVVGQLSSCLSRWFSECPAPPRQTPAGPPPPCVFFSELPA
jgi:hypothetical protein